MRRRSLLQGETVVDYEHQYLTIIPIESAVKVMYYLPDEQGLWYENGTLTTGTPVNLQYSIDNGSTWNTLTVIRDSDVNQRTIQSSSITSSIPVGTRVLFKSVCNNIIGEIIVIDSQATMDDIYDGLTELSKVNIEGNIMSLVYGDNFYGKYTLAAKKVLFFYTFTGTNIVNAENLILPATVLYLYCYSNMFSGCTCLETPPRLPATTLAKYCYYQMFMNCTSMESSPVLGALNPLEGSYAEMFKWCDNLKKIYCYATNVPSSTAAWNVTSYWVNGVYPTGTLDVWLSEENDWNVKANYSGCPSGWTITCVEPIMD